MCVPHTRAPCLQRHQILLGILLELSKRIPPYLVRASRHEEPIHHALLLFFVQVQQCVRRRSLLTDIWNALENKETVTNPRLLKCNAVAWPSLEPPQRNT